MMITGVDHALKHVPQNERRTETRKKIVDAAMMLFSTKGYYRTNSKEIAREAGVAIGSFYTYFADKKEVLKYILSTYTQDVLPEFPVSEPAFPADRKAMVRGLIEKSFNQHVFSHGFYQQFTLLSTVDEEVGQVFKEHQNTILSRISDLLMSYMPKKDDNCRKTASLIIYSAIQGSLHAVKFARADIEEGFLIDELVQFIDLYLSA